MHHKNITINVDFSMVANYAFILKLISYKTIGFNSLVLDFYKRSTPSTFCWHLMLYNKI